MAPPLDRRPGFSKRAHFGIFTAYVVAITGALLGLIVLIVSLVDPQFFSFARTSAADAAKPIGEASAVGRSSSKTIFDLVSGYIEAGSKNAALREQLRLAKTELAEAGAIREENVRLKRLLRLRETGGRALVSARLIGSSGTSTRRFALLNAGRRQGIEQGMPVRSPMGLVGRVLEVGSETARVLLITDGESVVPVRRPKGNVAGFAQGQANGTVIIRLIEMGINPLNKGDVLLTSGSGGLYRPNVPVAVITETTRDGGVARILSDPAATEFVIVEPIWQPITDLPPPPDGTAP